MNKLLNSDCLEALKLMPDNCIDSIVTDPPYGLAFMGKKWDYDVPSVELWAECLRVLKPGGHLLAFAGTRTQHRMAVRIEDAGFEIRDMIAWVYGSGFPKSHDVSKAIDKLAGVEREVISTYETHDIRNAGLMDKKGSMTVAITAPATDAAKQWQGWGTALKPALEPITVARKPLIGTVADNVLAHGTGGINIDGCRVEGGERPLIERADQYRPENFNLPSESCNAGITVQGRWPANLIHDGSDEVVAMFPNTTPSKAANRGIQQRHEVASPETARPKEGSNTVRGHNDNGGSASRFFYCAKASKKDRDEGLEEFALAKAGALNMRTDSHSERNGMTTQPRANTHPTVKPTELMRYLCRLVTPPGGVVLDPFMGSGSTGKAAVLEGFKFIGIEREAAYFEIASARVMAAFDYVFNELWM